jgi:hypothetical protein
VATADAIAAQLMGYKDPHENIEHLKLAHERNLGDAAQTFDPATLPILKYFTPGFLHILNDIAKWSMDRQPDTPESKKRKQTNLNSFSRFLCSFFISWKATWPDHPLNSFWDCQLLCFSLHYLPGG